MAVEAGADTGLFPADETTAAYLDGRTERAWRPSAPIPTPSSPAALELDLSSLEPLVAKPHLPGNVVPVSEVAGTRVDQAYIGNCANGTMTDLRQAAEVLRGNRVHRDCRLIVVPATQRIYREALARGLARPLRRGWRDGVYAHLRRMLRRRHGRARRRGARRDDHEPQLPWPYGLRPKPRSTSRTRGSPLRQQSQASSSIPQRSSPEQRHDHRGQSRGHPRRRRRHRRHVPRPVPQHRGSRAHESAPLRGLRPLASRPARAGHDHRHRGQLRPRLLA